MKVEELMIQLAPTLPLYDGSSSRRTTSCCCYSYMYCCLSRFHTCQNYGIIGQ